MISVVLFAGHEKEARDRISEIRENPLCRDGGLILVDFTPGFALTPWAEAEHVIAFRPKDEKTPFSYGELLTKVQETAPKGDDLYLTTDRFPVTESCLTALTEVFSVEPDLAAVGGIFPDFNYFVQGAVTDASENGIQHTLYLESEVLCIRRAALEELGGVDRALYGKREVLKDWFLQVMRSRKWKMGICERAEHRVVPGCAGREDDVYDADIRHFESKWGVHYVNLVANTNLIDYMLPCDKPVMRVLEIGCSCGATLYSVKERYPNAEIFGCDINAAAVGIASFFSDARVIDLENEELPWPKYSFDCILCGDILEHLLDPQGILRKMRQYLVPGGYVVASIPNLMHITVMENLLKGNFTYTEYGLLDRTHIHFFTFDEIARMFTIAGYRIDEIFYTMPPITKAQEDLIGRLLALNMGAEEFMYRAFQYLLRAAAI
ncbi:MAG: class I SAM-dependent methyltransferase [Lachnospiraceae bacterium]|nr:class I SAM-dependent methyltransferase [Lachnospiraceae bacterium]